MNKIDFDLEWERNEAKEARDQRDKAVNTLREIYRIRGEDTDIAKIANQVLDTRWASDVYLEEQNEQN